MFMLELITVFVNFLFETDAPEFDSNPCVWLCRGSLACS